MEKKSLTKEEKLIRNIATAVASCIAEEVHTIIIKRLKK